MQRRLIFTDATSDKFWYIDQIDDIVTVVYGRRGTAGQTKTKSYASADAAAKDAAKQVAAKLKKGYTDDAQAGDQPLTPGPVSAPTPAAADSSAPQSSFTDSASSTEPAASTAARLASAKTTDAAKTTEATRDVAAEASELGERDDLGLELFWHERGWDLTRPVEPRYDERPFDLETERARAAKIARFDVHYWYSREWRFTESPFEGIPSPERATFWVDYLDDHEAAGLDGQRPRWARSYVKAPPDLRPFLDQMAGRRPIARELTEINAPSVSPLGWLSLRLVLDAVPAEEKEILQEALAELWWDPQAARCQALLPYFSFVLGVHQGDIARVLDAAEEAQAPDRFLAFLKPTPAERVAFAEKVGLQPWSSTALLVAWLANTGGLGFDLLARGLGECAKEEAAPKLSLLSSRLHGPGAVRLFVLLLQTRHAGAGMAWLRAHVPQVLAADLSQQDAELLAPILRTVPADQLRVAQQTATGGVQKLIETLLAEAALPEFDPATPWWAGAAAEVKPVRLPKHLTGDSLPPVLVGDGTRLGSQAMTTLLHALAAEDRNQPLLAAVREHVPARARDGLAQAMLDLWLANGAAPKERWLMTGAGCIAGDGFVHRLTPLVREWPGVSQHKRAVSGLDALRNVGSDVALQAIAGIAAKVKFAAIKKRAGEVMEEIADTLGLSREQLEDRIIPDGGLDERGTREFSFGTRRFRANLTPEGKVVVRQLDEDGRPTGKPKTTLPAPNKSDDADLAADAKTEFGQLKKTLTGLAKIQRQRFEAAMIGGRRWTAAEFEQYIAPHPLLRGLLAPVVWGVYDDQTRVGLGRLDEDGTVVDLDDEPVDYADHSLGVIHPVDLTAEERAAWAELQADFELVEAFPQLSRPIYHLPADQGDDLLLHGVPEGPREAGKYFGATNKYGWTRGEALDGGVYCLYGKYFEAADVTAVLQFEPGMWMGPVSEQDAQTIEGVYLLRGKQDPRDLGFGAEPGVKNPYQRKEYQHVAWREVPPAVINEVISTTTMIGS